MLLPARQATQHRNWGSRGGLPSDILMPQSDSSPHSPLAAPPTIGKHSGLH